ncbi:MAG: hypothetical protein D9N14_22160 [Ketobacter sp.]|nr:MAG: hypothetical protein D9N14_22160 [Ketobacter sp.]
MKEVWPGPGVNCLANILPGKQGNHYRLSCLVSFSGVVDTGGDLMQHSLWHQAGNKIAKIALFLVLRRILFQIYC